MSDQEVQQGKTTAIIAYLTLVGSLIAITMNLEPKNGFARMHTRQAFGTHISFHALAIVFNYSDFLFAWMGLYLFYLVLWGYGFIGAISGKRSVLPVIGPYFQKWFTFIQ
ncbi:MAG: hypothetical protein HRT65_03740 [Flavobacteriaceae bacterium]|uniref:hypothetical protein n=1 Tax=Flagellimonas algarum TaxID=3230298 RepID=UPI0033916AA7|nr:hypothetical protein [Flavobacteriaceae bacterium]